ncbi:hypothetical protein M569_17348, partial [Genlisea aurea]
AGEKRIGLFLLFTVVMAAATLDVAAAGGGKSRPSFDECFYSCSKKCTNGGSNTVICGLKCEAKCGVKAVK